MKFLTIILAIVAIIIVILCIDKYITDSTFVVPAPEGTVKIFGVRPMALMRHGVLSGAATCFNHQNT